MTPAEPASAPRPIPGLARERTALAFSRSGLSVVGCLALLTRRLLPLDARTDHVVEVVLLASAATIWAASLAIGARRASVPPLRTEAQHHRFRLITVSTTAIAGVGFLICLFAPS